jgi:thiol-disulfide isomerase/thioredoxin
VPFIAGGVVVAVVLTVLNLVLTIGVIRRLREHNELLSARPAMGPADVMLGVGETPDDFTVLATDGERVSRETLTGEQLVGFFSPGCGPCEELVPRFAERAAALGRSHVLAVVAAGPEEADTFLSRLEPVARVVLDRDTDPDSVSRAFKVRGFPAICQLDADRVVTGSGPEILRAATRSPVS